MGMSTARQFGYIPSHPVIRRFRFIFGPGSAHAQVYRPRKDRRGANRIQLRRRRRRRTKGGTIEEHSRALKPHRRSPKDRRWRNRGSGRRRGVRHGRPGWVPGGSPGRPHVSSLPMHGRRAALTERAPQSVRHANSDPSAGVGAVPGSRTYPVAPRSNYQRKEACPSRGAGIGRVDSVDVPDSATTAARRAVFVRARDDSRWATPRNLASGPKSSHERRRSASMSAMPLRRAKITWRAIGAAPHRCRAAMHLQARSKPGAPGGQWPSSLTLARASVTERR